MKKVLSIVLSICLIVTSISAVLTQSVSAAEATTEVVFDENTILGTPVEDVSTFYNANNWYYSSDGSKNMFDATIQKTGKASEITDGSVDYDGDSKAIAIANPYADQVYIPFKVEKNTSYRFSFYIKGSAAGLFSSGSGIANSTFTATGTPGTGLNGVAGMHELLLNNSSSTSPTGLAGNYAPTTRKAGNYQLSTDNWVEISYTFNSQDNEDFYYFFRGSTEATYYLDGFKLLKDYYNPEDILFWRTYKYNDSTYGATIGGETPFYGVNGTTNSSVWQTKMGGNLGYCNTTGYFNDTETDNGYSIHSYGANRHYSVSFSTLKPNTKYKLSFSVRTANNAGLRYSVVANGSTLTAATTFSPAALHSVYSAVTTDAFKPFSFEFTTDDTNYEKLWLTFYGNNSGNGAYYDSIKLEEYVAPKKYKVNFNTDGGSDVAAIEGYEGDTITLPADPTKDGYTFAGWYTDAECTTEFTATTFTAEDITVYAKWDKIDPFMQLANWEQYSDAAMTNAGWGSTTLNTNTAYTYGGDASSINIRGYAQWSTVQFTVQPNTNYTLSYRMMYNGTPTDTTKLLSVSAITSVGGTADWGKDGCYDIYNISGSARCDSGLWATNNDAVSTTATRGNVKQWVGGNVWHQVNHSFVSGSNTTMVLVFRVTAANDSNFYVDDFQLVAGETYTPVTITFDTNDGDPIAPLVAKAGETVTVPDATKTDKVFAGWYTDDTLTTAFDGTALDSDFTLYADWADYKITKTSGVLIKEFADTPLHQWASYGDIVNLSFDYRLVSGDAAFYPITSNSNTTFNQAKWYYDNNGETKSKTAINGFTYNSEDVNEGSSAWQNYSATHSVRAATNIDGQFSDEALTTPITVEDFLGYVSIHFTKGGDTKSTDDLELYISNVNFEATGNTNSLDAGWEKRAAICAAENSTTGQNGLRVYNEVNTAWFEDADIVEYGSIVTYERLLDGELTLDSAKYAQGIAYKEGAIDHITFENTTNGKIHTSYLININPAYFAENIVIRTYAIDRAGNVYYDNGAFELCVYDVLYAMDHGNTPDGSEPTQLDIDTFAYFVKDVAADYAQWCEDNGKTTGALFAALDA